MNKKLFENSHDSIQIKHFSRNTPGLQPIFSPRKIIKKKTNFSNLMRFAREQVEIKSEQKVCRRARG